MSNINFVPDDYVQNNESGRTNLMYLVLFIIVMAGLFGSFITIKIRQRLSGSEEKIIDTKLADAQQILVQLEQLQSSRQEMIKAAITTSSLLEPVPRSVLLASLTNNLPRGVSFIKLDIVQKEPKKSTQAKAANKFKAVEAENAEAAKPKVSREKLLETHIDIEGIAGNDLQVAAYIERLNSSALLCDVALVESKEYKAGSSSSAKGPRPASLYRQFKLSAMLRKEVVITDDDIKQIASNAEELRI